ncbi:DUF4159 domain-containing protein [Paraliomyxa miuraensis]|uniref:DUF4159 domain-containing protein n=1 Tax=Paraliomyxa miuraensis TaxID=376150 RepID=UPI00225B4A74|nr:DUF4159 domain-containing protein [Paraliomyxa miuraensis]MCX4241386.1 DUF4159 domain-containing protein [Paraliomyxa miuraensis]
MRPVDLTRRTLLTGLGAAALVPVAGLARSVASAPGGSGSRASFDPIPAAPPGPGVFDPTTPDWDDHDPAPFDPFTGNLHGVDSSTITIDLPQLRYEGNWNPRPGAMRVLARELRLRTRLEPALEPGEVAADADALFSTPFLYVAGEGELPPLPPGGEEALRRFIDLGGLILFDAADGGTDPGFVRDVKALLQRIAPASEVAPVGRDHVLYRSFYLVDAPMGRTRTHDHVLGVQDEGRLRALVMRNDLGGALAETNDGLPAYPCTPGGNVQREWAVRFGVNVLLYATCTDYKADRAHVETLLRSRRWR